MNFALYLITKKTKMRKQFVATVLLFTTTCILLSACKNANEETAITKLTPDEMNAKSKTIENMQAAYKGEVTAAAKYAAYSTTAEKEGYHNIALLFTAVSAAESIHATNHKAVIENSGADVPDIKPVFTVKSTKENLKEDINDEAYEATTMYPTFIKTAELAQNDLAVLSLTYAMKTEKKHKYFFEQVLGDINSNTLNSLPSTYFVCPVCGNTYTTAPRHCDFSLTDRDRFIKFD
jgi:rubrerythrin